MSGVGKLRKILKEKCPDCGVSLQLRVRGEKIVGKNRGYSDEYVYCPLCLTETSLRRKIKRIKGEKDEEEW